MKARQRGGLSLMLMAILLGVLENFKLGTTVSSGEFTFWFSLAMFFVGFYIFLGGD